MVSRRILASLTVIILAVFCAAGAGYYRFVYRTTVRFADPMLEAAVRQSIEHPSGRITTQEALTWERLELSGAGIQDLSGLEHFSRLSRLDLARNRIVNTGPLEALADLTYLSLGNNQVADVEPLGQLRALEELYLQGNLITDITPLAQLGRLKTLVLSENPGLGNLGAGNPRVEMLGVRGCGLTSLDALHAFPSLVTIDAGDNAIQSLGGLSSCPRLAMANLEGNRIAGFGPPLSSPHLAILNLNDNALDRVDVFPALQSLERLELAGNAIVHLPDISPLPSLRVLNLDDNPLSDAICQGAAYYRDLGVSIRANRCPEIPAFDIAEQPEGRPEEVPGWMRRQLEAIERDRNRPLAPGFIQRPSTPADLQKHYDPRGTRYLHIPIK